MTRQSDVIPRYFTPKEAAALLRVPISWIYDRTRTREIPLRKLGRHVRIPKDELLAWIDQEGGEIK